MWLPQKCLPSLNSASASSIFSGVAYFPSHFPLPSGLPAQWALSTGSDISSRHTCWKLLCGTAEWKMKHFLWVLSFFASDPWSEPAVNHTLLTRSCSLTACSDNFTGEFGSVREALLKLDDGSFQKVAVKMLKGMWEQGYLNYLRKETLERLNVVCCILSKSPGARYFSLSFPLSHSIHVVSHPVHVSLFVVEALQERTYTTLVASTARGECNKNHCIM